LCSRFCLFGWKAWNPEFSRQAYAADSSSDVTSKTRLRPLMLLGWSIPILNEKCEFFHFIFSSKHVNITTIVTFVTLFGCIINTCSLHIINNYSNCIQQQKQVFINFL
jgi:hypothetical protein